MVHARSGRPAQVRKGYLDRSAVAGRKAHAADVVRRLPRLPLRGYAPGELDKRGQTPSQVVDLSIGDDAIVVANSHFESHVVLDVSATTHAAPRGRVSHPHRDFARLAYGDHRPHSGMVSLFKQKLRDGKRLGAPANFYGLLTHGSARAHSVCTGCKQRAAHGDATPRLRTSPRSASPNTQCGGRQSARSYNRSTVQAEPAAALLDELREAVHSNTPTHLWAAKNR